MRYTLYIINSDSDFDYCEPDYESAKKYAWSTCTYPTIEKVLFELIHSLNFGSFSDQDYYVLCDEETKTIIYI